MKVIFLDFNGVIITREYDFVTGKYFSKFNHVAISNINELVEKTKSLVVVSSSWRTDKTEYEIKKILAKHGFKGQILSTTPRYVRKNRGQEIEDWLRKYKTQYRVSNIVILDDKTIEGRLRKYHIHVNKEFGLTAFDVKQAEELLGLEELIAI